MRYLIGCIILLGRIVLPFLMQIQQTTAQDLIQDEFLVVVADIENRSNLYKIDLQSGTMIPLLTSKAFDLMAVAFDPVERVVYWTDVEQGLIGKNSLDGSRRSQKIIFKDTSGTTKFIALTLDFKNRKLYCGDRGNFSKIVEMNLDGSQQLSIINETGMIPRALVVDAEKRVLYYTDYGTQSGIYVIDLSTYLRTTILTGKRVWPTALAIDFEERVMYWTDDYIDSIEMANLDGSERVTLVTEKEERYFAMALSSQYLYITDRNHNSLKRLDRKTHIMSKHTPEVLGTLYGIVYYNSNVARDRLNSTIQIDRLNSTIQIVSSDHAMVWIVAITVGGLVSITGMVALSACYVAKRRRLDRTPVNAEQYYMTPMEHTLTNPNEFTGDRSSQHYEYILPFDTTTADDEKKY